MLNIGANVNQQIKPVAASRKRESGHMRMKKKDRRGSANVLWKRVTAAYDEDVRNFAKNPALVAPVTRWVLYGHITSVQGAAARRYAAIVCAFERYTMPSQARSPRSANLEPVRAEKDQEIERHIVNGTLGQHEADARDAKRQYKRLMKVMDRFRDHVTGRNFAKDHLDELCLNDREPDARFRQDIALVLTAVAKEFGIGENRRKVQ